MGRKKRTKAEREEALIVVARMFRQGYTHNEIAKVCEVSRPQVIYDLKTLHKRWSERTTLDLDVIKRGELEKLDLLEREAWQAWEASKQDDVTKTDEYRTGDTDTKKNGALSREVRRGQVGDPRFLERVQAAQTARAKLLGLDSPVKLAATDIMGEHDLLAMSDGKLLEALTGFVQEKTAKAEAIDIPFTEEMEPQDPEETETQESVDNSA